MALGRQESVSTGRRLVGRCRSGDRHLKVFDDVVAEPHGISDVDRRDP